MLIRLQIMKAVYSQQFNFSTLQQMLLAERFLGDRRNVPFKGRSASHFSKLRSVVFLPQARFVEFSIN